MADSFVWYQLTTTNPQAAEAFYRAVVGWDAQPWPAPDGGMPYTILSAAGRPVAGIAPMPADATERPPGWSGFVGVADVDSSAARVVDAGGRVLRDAADIPQVGRFALVADPHGAAFILFRPDGPAMPPVPAGTPGHVGWHELMTQGWSETFDFYAGLFGWTKDFAVDLGAMGTYQTFAADGRSIGGMMDAPPHIPFRAWGFYFTVPEIDAGTARITEAGGKILMGPHQVPGGSWIVQATDPQGALFALTAARQ